MWECKAKSIEAAAEEGDPNVKISKVLTTKELQFLMNINLAVLQEISQRAF